MTDSPAASMPFSSLMGIEITETSADLVAGSLVVRPDLCTIGNIIHGGALMAFADALGAIAAFINLPEGASGTTTIESKTNFLAAAAEGSTITASTTPIHVGRRLSTWQTDIVRDDGRRVALVTQTQLVL